VSGSGAASDAGVGNSDTGLALSRTVPASKERVWTLWTDAGQLARWWWPERFGTRYHIDPSVGGSFRFTTDDVAPFGVLDLAGTFLDVERPSLLRYTWRWESDLGYESRVAVDFVDAGQGFTEIRLRHTGLKDGEDRDNHVTGWNDCLDRLEALLQGGP
jgi:uncharacterized protein YndB with AHSA1/START domain